MSRAWLHPSSAPARAVALALALGLGVARTAPAQQPPRPQPQQPDPQGRPAAQAQAQAPAVAQPAQDAPAAAAPVLEPLTPAQLDALRPLALRGAAVLVRDADAGPRARITVLLRARAPLAGVRAVITAPEHYPAFMPLLGGSEVISRRGSHTAFRFRVSAILFDVTTLAALRVVNDQRVDVAIVQSDVGPGASRWDLYPDGDGTLVALSTWGDPSQGNWLLRQVARRSPAAIAGMNISTDILLALAAVRRAEILAGVPLPPRPAAREAPPPPALEPPAPGPWQDLARTMSVAAIVLDASGAVVQSTVAVHAAAAPAVVCRRLEDVAGYASVFRGVRDVRVLATQGATVRYRYAVESTLGRLQGEEDRTVELTPAGPRVWWRGVAGDFRGDAHRWDLVAAPGGGTVVMLTGPSEYQRSGWTTRQMIDRDAWLMPGYSASWKLVAVRALLAGL